LAVASEHVTTVDGVPLIDNAALSAAHPPTRA
jgi:hypothetical protein